MRIAPLWNLFPTKNNLNLYLGQRPVIHFRKTRGTPVPLSYLSPHLSVYYHFIATLNTT
jgi:hypothetical protein